MHGSKRTNLLSTLWWNALAVQFLVEGVQPHRSLYNLLPSMLQFLAISLNVVSSTGECLCNAVTSPLEDTDVCIIMQHIQSKLRPCIYTFWSQHICHSANASPAILISHV